MAIAKTARVLATQSLFDDSRLVTLRMPESEPLGFVGGQYIIVDSGELLPTGKAAKRAYSILSADSEQGTVTLAVLRLGMGPGSRYMHRVIEGDTVTFSGPWGKLRPTDTPGSTLVCATDTGITAALGLVRGTGYRAMLPRTTFVWLKRTERCLMPESMVRDFLPPGMHHVRIATCANASDLERTREALQTTQATPSGWQNAYAVGDGAVNVQLREALNQAGTEDGNILHESFFNAPKRV